MKLVGFQLNSLGILKLGCSPNSLQFHEEFLMGGTCLWLWNHITQSDRHIHMTVYQPSCINYIHLYPVYMLIQIKGWTHLTYSNLEILLSIPIPWFPIVRSQHSYHVDTLLMLNLRLKYWKFNETPMNSLCYPHEISMKSPWNAYEIPHISLTKTPRNEIVKSPPAKLPLPGLSSQFWSEISWGKARVNSEYFDIFRWSLGIVWNNSVIIY